MNTRRSLLIVALLALAGCAGGPDNGHPVRAPVSATGAGSAESVPGDGARQEAGDGRSGDVAAAGQSSPDPPASAESAADPGPAPLAVGLGDADDPSPPVRIAILPIGRPRYQSEYTSNVLGVHITADALRRVVPMLEAEHVDVVVLDVNLQWGYWAEAEAFRAVIEQEFLPRYRTVAWIDETVSAASLAMLAIPDLYFHSTGLMGPCPGVITTATPDDLSSDPVLVRLADTCERNRHDLKVVRAMTLAEPLSVQLAPGAAPKWVQSEISGQSQRTLNRAGRLLTLSAQDAVRYGFARGVVFDRTSLAATLGCKKYQFVGEDAARELEHSMAVARTEEAKILSLITSLRSAILLADAAMERAERDAQIVLATEAVDELEYLVGRNPMYAIHFNGEASVPADPGRLGPVWFETIRRGINEIRRKELTLDELIEPFPT